MKLSDFFSNLPGHIKGGIIGGTILSFAVFGTFMESFLDVKMSRPAMIHEIKDLKEQIKTLEQQNRLLKTILILQNNGPNQETITILLKSQQF